MGLSPQFLWNETYNLEFLPAERQALPFPVQNGGPNMTTSHVTPAGSPENASEFYSVNHTGIHESVNLTLRLGPKRQELYKVVPITVVYCIIFFTGIVGNVCTCVVIAKNKYMHTATNYYLCNLAVADLLVLVLGLPQETYQFWSAYPWVFGNAFCVIRTMAAETSTYASILTITAFTVER